MPKPTIAQKSPFVVKLEAGVYAWCACGNSKNQPYCDGSHKGSEFSPIVEKIGESKTVAWCGCKQSSGKPYCDGTHAKL
ncbi:MAG: CDGSH iron-sulfur domain-containing protein [Vicingaceae bacterium]